MRPDSIAIDGWVVRYDENVAAIAPCEGCAIASRVPIDGVVALEAAHTGRRFLRRVGRGLAAGAAAGATIGLIAGTGYNCNGYDGPCGPGFTVPTGIVLGGGIGLLIGVVSYALAPSEVWTAVRRP